MRKILYSVIVKKMMIFILSFFYKKKYLQGYYFDTKRIGFYWCFRSLGNHLWGTNRSIAWPVNPNTLVANGKNVFFDINDLHIFQTPGCYWQAHNAKIVIGKGCHIAPNVGIITTNHDIYDVSRHIAGKDVILGDGCWIGMNAVVLPGCVLGNNTVVAAGAVVTHSFVEGNCIVGGVPAKKIKDLNR